MMNQTVQDYSLAELMIAAAADAFRGDGEVLATGIGLLPRLAASLAMKTCNPDMMMTDSEAYLLSEPNPVSGRKSHAGQAQETWMGFSRIFDNVWSGKRHAMVGPSQIDRYGQTNISALGGTYQQPKVQMLGARGFPGNSLAMPILFLCRPTANGCLLRMNAMWCAPWVTTRSACPGVTHWMILTFGW